MQGKKKKGKKKFTDHFSIFLHSHTWKHQFSLYKLCRCHHDCCFSKKEKAQFNMQLVHLMNINVYTTFQ